MRNELTDILKAYLSGWKTVRDIAEWLSGIEWDSSVDSEIQQFVGCVELLATEVLEGLRPETEFWQEAAKLVEEESGLLYIQLAPMFGTTIAESSSATNFQPIGITVGEGVAAEESLSWSILPLPVSG